jgi:hypothetical protein
MLATHAQQSFSSRVYQSILFAMFANANVKRLNTYFLRLLLVPLYIDLRQDRYAHAKSDGVRSVLDQRRMLWRRARIPVRVRVRIVIAIIVCIVVCVVDRFDSARIADRFAAPPPLVAIGRSVILLSIRIIIGISSRGICIG